MVFLVNLGVNLHVCLCGDHQVTSVQTLDFLSIGQKSSFPAWKLTTTAFPISRQKDLKDLLHPPASILARWQIRQASRNDQTPLTSCRTILPPRAACSSEPSLPYRPVFKWEEHVFLTTFAYSAPPRRSRLRFSPCQENPSLLHRPRLARNTSRSAGRRNDRKKEPFPTNFEYNIPYTKCGNILE